MPTKNTRSAPEPTDTRTRVRVRVQVASRARRIPQAARFRAWVGAALTAAARTGAGRTARAAMDVTIRLVGANEARSLNLAYRGLDHATNVLTFAYAPDHGDIVLCPQVLAREARLQGKALEAHYAHLTVHALLHLRGYEHARRADAKRMERVEIRILKELGFPNPYVI